MAETQLLLTTFKGLHQVRPSAAHGTVFRWLPWQLNSKFNGLLVLPSCLHTSLFA